MPSMLVIGLGRFGKNLALNLIIRTNLNAAAYMRTHKFLLILFFGKCRKQHTANGYI